MNGIERRIERLEKELSMTDEPLLIRIVRFAEKGEVVRFRCGEAMIDRLPGESEAAFETRAEGEARRLADPSGFAVMIETRREKVEQPTR